SAVAAFDQPLERLRGPFRVALLLAQPSQGEARLRLVPGAFGVLLLPFPPVDAAAVLDFVRHAGVAGGAPALADAQRLHPAGVGDADVVVGLGEPVLVLPSAVALVVEHRQPVEVGVADRVVAHGHPLDALDEAVRIALHPPLVQELMEGDDVGHGAEAVRGEVLGGRPQQPAEEARVVGQQFAGAPGGLVVDDEDAEAHAPPLMVEVEDADAEEVGGHRGGLPRGVARETDPGGGAAGRWGPTLVAPADSGGRGRRGLAEALSDEVGAPMGLRLPASRAGSAISRRGCRVPGPASPAGASPGPSPPAQTRPSATSPARLTKTSAGAELEPGEGRSSGAETTSGTALNAPSPVHHRGRG